MEFIKRNKYNILTIVSVAAVLICFNVFYPVMSLDELWKYNDSKAILTGNMIYKDINLVTTPFYFYLTSFFLLINKSLVGFRIMNVIMWGITYYLMYSILKNRITDSVSSVVIFAIAFFNDNYIFDYNILLLTLSLAITYIVIKHSELTVRHLFVLGILCALADLTKQSVGLIIVFVTLIFVAYKERKNPKKTVAFLCGCFIPNFIFLLYLLSIHALGDFFDICLFGLATFKSNSITIMRYCLYKTSNALLVFTMIIVFCCSIISLLKNRKDSIALYLGLFVALFILVFPICDNGHIVSSYLYMVCLVSEIIPEKYLILLRNSEKKSSNLFSLSVIAVLVCVVIYAGKMYTNVIENGYVRSNHTNYKGLYLREAREKSLGEINEFLNGLKQERKVVLLSSNSCMYSILNDEFNGVYDTFNVGNFGTKEPVQFVQESLDEGCYIVISQRYKEEGWQNPVEVFDYLQENCQLVMETDLYYVYVA